MRNITDTGVGAKLNLGCGDDVRPDYLNIDFRKTHPNVIEVDLSTYPWPFADRSAKEILMLDFLEHFPYANTAFILLECYRVLQDDGEVVIQVPDGAQLGCALAQRYFFWCNRCGQDMTEHNKCPTCGQTRDEISEAAMMRLYGGQDHKGNFHHTCFTQSSLLIKCKAAGLDLIAFEEFVHQSKNWNFKARFRKGSVW